MTETIEKVEERHTKQEMTKRDGETGMGVGLFVFALSIPVIIGTFYGLDNPRAATVNCICGIALFLIGAGAIAYGWMLYQRSKTMDES